MDMHPIKEIAERAITRGRPFATPFFGAEEREQALAFARKQGYPVSEVGGSESPERARLVFLPQADFTVSENTFLCALKISVNDRQKYTHRDYLGSVMALKVERDRVGDILVFEGYALLFTLPELSAYFCNELKTVSRTGCTVEQVPLANLSKPISTKEEVSFSVSSLRADCVVCALFRLSREQCANAIERGQLRVDGETVYKPEKRLVLPAQISLRGSGRAEASEETGVSKRGKLRIRGVIYR